MTIAKIRKKRIKPDRINIYKTIYNNHVSDQLGIDQSNYIQNKFENQDPIKESLINNVLWTEIEKQKFFQNIYKFKNNLKGLIPYLPDKSILDIIKYYEALNDGLLRYKSSRKKFLSLLRYDEFPQAYEMDEQLIELEDSLSEELNKRENDNLTKIHKKNQRTNPTNDIDDDDNNDNSNNDGDDDDLDKVINHEELNNIFKYLKNYKVGDSNDWKQFYYDYFKKLMPSIMEEFDGILKDLIKSFISRFLYEKLTKQYEFSKITNFEINKLLFKVTSNDIKTFFNNVNDRPWNKDWFFWEYLNGLNLNKTEISNYKSELNLNLSLYHKSSIIKQSIIETEFQDQEEEEEEEEITEQNDELEEKDEELEYILFQIETFQTTIIDCYRAELFNIDQYKQFQIPPPQVIDVSYSGFEYLDGLKLSFQTKINLIKELTKLLDIEIDQDLCENIVPEMSMIYNYTFTNNE